jgi:perosamine synthetase
VNGTSALQLALYVSGVRVGDEVAVPALSFVATANAVKFLGAEPVFVDSVSIDQDLSMGISLDSFTDLVSSYEERDGNLYNPKTGARLSAVVPMHTLGRVLDLEELTSFSKSLGVAVVEDAAEALGSFKGGKHPGAENIAILSFNGNKSITTGGGGAIITNNSKLADTARRLGSTAKEQHAWRFRHSDVGWNFRLPALNAALGCAQLEQLPAILEAKSSLAKSYSESFTNSEFFSFIPTPNNQVSNNWLSAIRLTHEDVNLNNLLDEINEKGIHCRPMWDLLSDLNPYKDNQKTDLTNAWKIRNSVICIPSSPKLGRIS